MMYIVVHDPVNNIPIYGDIFGTNALALPIRTQEDMYLNMHLAVGTEETVRLNTGKKPCRDIRANLTLSDCIDNHFQEVEGCVLPWHLNEVPVTVSDMCNKTNLKHYQEYMEKFISDGSYGEEFWSTGCIPNCKQSVNISIFFSNSIFTLQS